MNDTTQTLIRSILKIGAGMLLAKGLIQNSEAEDLIGAALGLIGVVWGILHRGNQSQAKQLTLFIFFLALSWSVTGCAPLAKDGVYSTQYQADAKVMYDADSTIATSYDVIHQFVLFEYQNRAALSGTPQVRRFADTMRNQSPGWFQSAIALRDAYALNPSPGARDALTTALNVLRQGVVEATRQMTSYGIGGLPTPPQQPPLPSTH